MPFSLAHAQLSWRSILRSLSLIDLRCATRYTPVMIKSFKHKGLRRFFETGSTAGIQANHSRRLRIQLAALDTAQVIEDLNLPGFRLHTLKGSRDGVWSISVSGNWRVTFEFVDGNAFLLDYEDYH
jgi:proteic killer suppression protein